MKRLILMIQLMTRIPIPMTIQVEEEDLGKGNVYFPLVGLLIGVLLTIVYQGGRWLYGDGLLTSVLVVCAYSWVSGGLHLDGLSDTFDGLWSNRSRERILEIMKDSRLGVFGGLSLILIILLQVSTISNLAGQWRWLLLTPILGRYGCVFAASIAEYARSEGMGKSYVEYCGRKEWFFASLYTCPLAFLLGGLGGLISLLLVLAFTYIFITMVQVKLKGITGDILGAVIELSQVIVLLYCIT